MTNKIKLFNELALEGDREAKLALGYCYKVGWGVESDGAKALEYFIQAAELNSVVGMFEASLCFGSGNFKNIGKSAEWYKKAVLAANLTKPKGEVATDGTANDILVQLLTVQQVNMDLALLLQRVIKGDKKL